MDDAKLSFLHQSAGSWDLGGRERRERCRRVLRTATKTPFPEGAQPSVEPRAPGMGSSLTI